MHACVRESACMHALRQQFLELLELDCRHLRAHTIRGEGVGEGQSRAHGRAYGRGRESVWQR